jgi:DnaJ-domain-containing protein 1
MKEKRQASEPSVSVYWNVRGQKNQRCMAIDRYDRVQDNLAAIAATLNAMRAIERHGGAKILDRAFTGFAALPAPEQPWQVLGLSCHASNDEVKDAYHRLVSEHHPDKGGDEQQMMRINAARDALLSIEHRA